MHLYLNYAREHWTVEGENPPVGLILCAAKDASVAHYALEGLPTKVLAATYRTQLPKEKTLAAEVEQTRRELARRRDPELGSTSTARESRSPVPVLGNPGCSACARKASRSTSSASQRTWPAKTFPTWTSTNTPHLPWRSTALAAAVAAGGPSPRPYA